MYNPWDSVSWQDLGLWELGLDWLGYGGNGDYGLETVAFTTTTSRIVTSVDSVLMSTINDTDYYQGFLGVGNTNGNFNGKVGYPLITQLAGVYDKIPSQSYGYTAGAYYAADGRGVPSSLVLGGYDTLRYELHGITFNIDPTVNLPEVLLRGISVSATVEDRRPSHWNSSTQTLLEFNATSNLALIDSSTPYLWLPTAVCEVFAKALNLTWIEDYGVYIFSDDSQYTQFLQDDPFEFTFSLSSFDYTDNFGQPLAVPGVVNITISSAAFAQLLRYPFKNQFQYGDPAVAYFPLKRADSGPMIIGRAFLQEAYLIMKYQAQTFGLYQAQFPDNAATNYSLMSLDRNGDSHHLSSTNSTKLNTGAIVGIAIGTVALVGVAALTSWCCCCRKRKRKAKAKAKVTTPVQIVEAVKEESGLEEDEPVSPLVRMLSRLRTRRRKPRRREIYEISGDNAQPNEAADHQLYEMRAPKSPAELAANESFWTNDITAVGTDGTMNAYAIEHQRLERQLQQGPAGSYYAPSAEIVTDVSLGGNYRPTTNTSPVAWPSYENNSSGPSMPSPTTPHTIDWQRRHFDLPSPMTVVPPMPSPFVRNHVDGDSTFAPYSPDGYYPPPIPSPPLLHNHPSLPQIQTLRSPHSARSFHLEQPPRSRILVQPQEPHTTCRSNSSQHSPVSPIEPPLPPSPTYQRSPIDSSNIVCLGPLPDNIRLPPLRPPQSTPRIVVPQEPSIAPSSASPMSSLHQMPSNQSDISPGPRHPDEPRKSIETLGSNYTVEEETRIQQQFLRSESMRGQERIDGFDGEFDWVHVPQVAHRRYSWENDR